MSRRRVGSALLLALALGAGVAGAGALDRLERFRELARSHLALAQLEGGDAADPAVAELYALVDDEVVESLESGGPFASIEFIQERLDGFAGAWGGAAFHILRPAAAGGRAPVTVGVFSLASVAGSGSMRLYGRSGAGIGLLRSVTHDGVPEVHEWPPARDGTAQWVVSWVGPVSGRGSRRLRAELWRQPLAGDAVRRWSTVELFPEGLWASALSVRRGEIVLRYELHYPGWKPGCEDQTEQEDVYREAAAGEGLVLARRQVFNGWHRELGSTVSRFFDALASQDARRLAELVPDARLRARLPASLRAEPACEAQSPDAPGMVAVAATDEPPAGPGPRPAAPWSLWWTRAPGGWRLAAARPVLQ